MNKLFRKFIDDMIVKGDLTVTSWNGDEFRFGDASGPPIHIRFRTRAAETGALLDPTLKVGESYMNGDLEFRSGTVYDFVKLIFTNTHKPVATSSAWLKLVNQSRRTLSLFSRGNGVFRSRSNAKHHYDLSGDLYELFLDEDKQYSCAYFQSADMDLEQAQLAKKRHIAAKLLIDHEDLSVLDIGSGWGGLGLYLARYLNASVTGVTLSDEQFGVSKRRAADEQLEARVDFLLEDYRNLNQRFDRIVSVGMFEHVGLKNYPTFFAKSAELLSDDGVMLLHTIGQSDDPTPTNPFIAKYIFPGGYIPSLSEIVPHVEKAGFIVTDIEVLRLHYAETLKAWRERFVARWDEAKALYDERFCRMWEFYLAVSESAFRWQRLVVFQIQLTKKVDAVPVTRDYISQAEAKLQEMDDEFLCAAAAVEA